MNAKLLIIFCLSLFLIISLANAEEGPGGGGETEQVTDDNVNDVLQDDATEAQDYVNQKTGADVELQDNGNYQFDPDSNTLTSGSGPDSTQIPLDDFEGEQISFENGKVFVGDNEYEGADDISKEGERTKTSAADYSNYANNEFWDVIDASFFPSGFDIGSASRIKTDKFTLENAEALKKAEDSLMLDSAGKFQLEESAKVKAGDAVFENIGESIIYMEDELEYANVVSSADNNTFSLADCSLNITVDKDDTAIVKKNKTSGYVFRRSHGGAALGHKAPARLIL